MVTPTAKTDLLVFFTAKHLVKNRSTPVFLTISFFEEITPNLPTLDLRTLDLRTLYLPTLNLPILQFYLPLPVSVTFYINILYP